jgi:hypothetical protein
MQILILGKSIGKADIRWSSATFMKSCRTMTILLLAALSTLAIVTRPAKPGNAHVQAQMTRPAQSNQQSPTVFMAPGSGVPFEIENLESAKLGSRHSDEGQGGNSLPLLSCIGAGMAIGGLLSARWANREDK